MRWLLPLALLLALARPSPAQLDDDAVASLMTFPVEGRLTYPDRSAPGTTKLSLNGGEHEAFSRADGSFTFHDVPPGVYLLDVLSLDAIFSQVKINLPEDPSGKVRCLEFRYPGAPKQPIGYPLELVAHGRQRYFEKREGWSLASFFKNPYSYMLLFTVFIIVVFPRMMSGMDPEQMKEMQAEMAKNDPAALLGQLFGGGAQEPEPQPTKQPSKKRRS